MADPSANTVRFNLIADIESLKKGFAESRAELEALSRKTQETEQKTRSAFEGMKTAFAGVFAGNIATQGFNSIMSGIGSIKDAMIGGNAEMETYTTQFTTLMGSADAAKQRLVELAKFGAETPFELPEIARAEKVLLGFGLSGEKAVAKFGKNGTELRTLIGDIAAGTGQRFEDIALYMGKFASGATGEAIARFQELGIATKEQMTALGVQFDKAGSLVSPLPTALQAVVKITEGKFAGGMKALSSTFDGMKSTLSDTLQQIGVAVGAPLFEGAKEGLSALLNVLNSPEVQAATKSLSEAFGAIFKPLFAMIGPITSGLMSVLSVLTPALQAMGSLLGYVSDNIGIFAAFAGAAGATALAVNSAALASKAWAVAEGIANTMRGTSLASMKAQIVALFTRTAATQVSTAATAEEAAVGFGAVVAKDMQTIATGKATAAQWLWNTALAANPIAAVIIGVAALTAGIVLLTDALTTSNAERIEEIDGEMKVNELLVSNKKEELGRAEATRKSAEEARRLAAELQATGDKAKDAGAKKERLKTLTQELGKTYPELIAATGDYGTSLQQIDKIIASTSGSITGLQKDLNDLAVIQRKLAAESANLKQQEAWSEIEDQTGKAIAGFKDWVANITTTTSGAQQRAEARLADRKREMQTAKSEAEVDAALARTYGTLTAMKVKANSEVYAKVAEAAELRKAELKAYAGEVEKEIAGKGGDKSGGAPPKPGTAKKGADDAEKNALAVLEGQRNARKRGLEEEDAGKIKFIELEEWFENERWAIQRKYNKVLQSDTTEHNNAIADIQGRANQERAAMEKAVQQAKEANAREAAEREKQARLDAIEQSRQNIIEAAGYEIEALETKRDEIEAYGGDIEAVEMRIAGLRAIQHAEEMKRIEARFKKEQESLELEIKRLNTTLAQAEATGKLADAEGIRGKIAEAEAALLQSRGNETRELNKEEAKENQQKTKNEKAEFEKRKKAFHETWAKPIAAEGRKVFESLFDESMTSADRMQMVWDDTKNFFIQMLGQMLEQWLANIITQQVMGATATGASTAQASMVSAAWAPAALAASVGTFGGASLIGASSLAGALATTQTLFSGMKFLAEGGIANRPIMAMIGEGGESEAVTPLSKLPGLLAEAGAIAARRNAVNRGTRFGERREKLDVRSTVTVGMSRFAQSMARVEARRGRMRQ